MKPNDLIIIDCEASGLSNNSYPIEIGIAFKNNSQSFLIKPEEDWVEWDSEAEKIHKIKRSELFENGISIFDAAIRMNSQLRDLKVYSDAVDFEIFWIDKLFSKVGVERNFDIESIYMLDFDPVYYKNIKRKNSKNIELHRAENDAILIRNSIIDSLN